MIEKLLAPIRAWLNRRKERKLREQIALNIITNPKKGRFAETLRVERPPDTGAPTTAPAGQELGAPMPEGVDFTALWEEPADPSMLTTMLAGAAAVLSLIGLIVAIAK